MNLPLSPLMLASALLMGSISAYLAYRRGKNPYLWFGVGFLFGLIGVFALFLGPKPQKSPPERSAAPVYTIDGPSDKFWYYLNPSEEQQGPMSKDSVLKAWNEGKLSPSTYVWHEELPDWKFLKDTLKLER